MINQKYQFREGVFFLHGVIAALVTDKDLAKDCHDKLHEFLDYIDVELPDEFPREEDR